ncbi:MAG: YraN family protein [Candidatus Buchananbacteria bacterium CG10_big_fil_rev_8_21_14_0_10_42_9]|uniref:UPF0102 protein COT81_02145 n=1 Tax=Candidatus Buchananbacteria bacterium CG10_big_fil_rev_8_21_14_0_10_42_9 TaxID=1974526 RepID=A0A2H0W3X8_9BACT|nr:MAG: YraN family protein [Candidatus Buchananbacteria bacterium CG10_big_fil_rev_8_21_14_0_10_42_9]
MAFLLSRKKLSKKELGFWGEKIARKYLRKIGYREEQSNFNTRRGEIDLIMYDGPTLVFIEVKTRTSQNFGLPEEAVTSDKLSALVQAAYRYINFHPEVIDDFRIDVIAVDIRSRWLPPTIRHYQNIVI